MKNSFLRIWKYIRIIIGGAVMVITDTIPGLSGSVFLSGAGLLKPVWSRWKLILKPQKKGDRWRAIVFYIMFGIGTTVGMVGFAKLIEVCMNTIPSVTFWFFLVAAIGGIFIFIKGNKKSIKPKEKPLSKNKRIILTSIGAIVIISLVVIFLVVHKGRVDADKLNSKNMEKISLSNGKLMTLICLAGFFSAFAMFTPGLSGGLIILVFGVYTHIFGGLLAHPEKYIPELVVYGISVFAGAATAILTWDKLFTKYAKTFIWLLIGMIVASTISIPILFDVFVPSNPLNWLSIVAACLVSFSLVYSTLKLMDHDHVIL